MRPGRGQRASGLTGPWQRSSDRLRCQLCAGQGCVSRGALDIREALEAQIHRRSLEDRVAVESIGCLGWCGVGPMMVVQPGGIFYGGLTVADIPAIVSEHLSQGRPVERLLFSPPTHKGDLPKLNEIEFFQRQRLIVLQNRGLIDPDDIEQYIARDGYVALEKALSRMAPEEIIQEMVNSGLRGRGGAGFPTGLKWRLTRRADDHGQGKFVCCNADEGDPGAFMDRSIIESDPHAVIEGMIIGAYAIGAAKGYVYIRNEYPLALERLATATRQARQYGLLGEDILGSGFDFDIKIVRGAGAFVCGEETALMASIEGRLGEPRPRPPFPTEQGIFGRPTNNNNVETWANVPVIIRRGADWFARIGTSTSKGTKVFSLVGKINNTGLVEVPMGITLREIIYQIGGGIPGGKAFKAVQTGGPSGGCLPAQLLDLPVDYESLAAAGSMMGSGGMVVLDEDTCMVDVARYFLSFTQDESCGKCTPCREGTRMMLSLLEKITRGEGTAEDLEALEQLAHHVQETSLCGLGKTAPNPVLTTLRYFRHEYEAHIRDRRCPARVCRQLNVYQVNPDRCSGCGRCVRECPSGAISEEEKGVARIDQERCVRCGICFDVCPFTAIEVS